MENPYFKIKRLDERAIAPSKREEDAGFDFYMLIEEEFKLLKKGEIFLAPTKLSCEFPKNWVLIFFERGSTGTKGISKRCGIIDSGYRGEIFIALNNTSNKNILFYKNESKIDSFLEENNLEKKDVVLYPQSKAIAQGILLYSPHINIEEVKELSSSERMGGKIGSSNK